MLREDVVEAVRNGQFAIYRRRHHRRGHRDPDRRQGRRARRRRALPGRHHQPAGRGQAQIVRRARRAASPRPAATPATAAGRTRHDRACGRRAGEDRGRVVLQLRLGVTRARSRSRRRCASRGPSSPRSRACSWRTSSCSTAPPSASCARSRCPAAQRRALSRRRHDARSAACGRGRAPAARGAGAARPRCRCARAWCATSRCGRCRSPAPRPGPWNVVALAEPFTGGTGEHAEAAADRGRRRHRPGRGRAARRGASTGPDRRRRRGYRAAARHAARRRAARRARRRRDRAAADRARRGAACSGWTAQARLVVEAREDVRIAVGRGRARRSRGDRRDACAGCSGGFVICQFGGLVVPDEGDLQPLASALECPLFLVR